MKVVLCHGTFDTLHYGHFKMFESAKRMGTTLIVSVRADMYVKGRPLFSQRERAFSVGRCKDVDRVEICLSDRAVPMIEKYQPDIYIRGGGQKAELEAEKSAVEAVGGKMVLADHVFTIHFRREADGRS